MTPDPLNAADLARLIDPKAKREKDGIWNCRCPAHDDHTASLSVMDKKDGGEPNVLCHAGCDYRAIKDVCRERGWLPPLQGRRRKTAVVVAMKPRKVEEFDAVIPPPPDAGIPDDIAKGKYTHLHVYRSREGVIERYIVRREAKAGRKTFVPYTWGTCNGVTGWHKHHANHGRALYHADVIAAHPDAVVVVVEGEKKADQAQALIDPAAFVLTTWSGGSNAVPRTSFGQLAGRAVIVWPDADPAGAKALDALAGAIGRVYPAELGILDLPDDLPPKWDVGDAVEDGWDGPRIVRFIQDHVRIRDARPEEPPPPRPASPLAALGPLTLGFRGDDYYYFARRSATVHVMTANAHTKMGLLSLAPLAYWENTRFSGGRDGLMIAEAADDLMLACERQGVFDAECVRGRGAWNDAEHGLVFHMGDHLIVAGERRPLISMASSRCVYEARPALPAIDVRPCSDRQARRFLDFACMASWQDRLSGYLAAGWVVTGLITGAMPWRPSIWITGCAGSGKGWVINNIVLPLLQHWCVHTEGDSTAKGLEQALQNDSLPIVFDEAEGNSDHQRQTLEAVTFLMRVAASSTGARQYKGTIDGKGRSARVRTQFAFASITPTVNHVADETRITMLPLVLSTDAEGFEKIRAEKRDLLTPACIAALRARIVGMAPIIIRNAEVFADCAGRLFGSRRTGDQLGAMLAGAFALTSPRVVSTEEAVEWLRRNDLGGHVSSSDPEEIQCWQHIMAHTLRIQIPGSGQDDHPIGKLILVAGCYDDSVPRNLAEDALAKVGIRTDTDGVWISSSHPRLVGIVMRNSTWAANHKVQISRLPGAFSPKKTIRFAAFSTRAWCIPWEFVTGQGRPP